MAPARKSERGFVLIGAVWLLLLAASLVAILMLRSRSTDAAAIREGGALQQDLDLDAARETVAADLLINGPRSQWWRLPARGSVGLGARSVEITMTSEAGRIDLNDADPKAIQDALLGLGFSPADAQAFLAGLLARRQQGRIVASAEIDRLIAPLTRANGRGLCLPDLFTIEAGLMQPDAGRAPPVLARALGVVATPDGGVVRQGEALRIAAASPRGAILMSVQRIGMLGGFPVGLSRRWVPVGCSVSMGQ